MGIILELPPRRWCDLAALATSTTSDRTRTSSRPVRLIASAGSLTADVRAALVRSVCVLRAITGSTCWRTASCPTIFMRWSLAFGQTRIFRKFTAMFKQRSAFDHAAKRKGQLWQEGYLEHI